MKININLSKALNLNYIVIIIILLCNLYIRYTTLMIFTDYHKLLIIFLFLMIVIISSYVKITKNIITFLFGFSFFLFGFRPYDVQSQIFETLVLLVTIFYFTENILHNNSKILNKNLRNLFILLIILSLGSLLLLPVKYLFYNIMSLGKEWYLYQIVNALPNSFYYPLNGVNKLILFFTFSVVMSHNSLKTFKVLFLGLFWGGLFCSIIGLLDYYDAISLEWYSKSVTQNVLSSTFMNRGWLAEYLLMITPLILVLFLEIKTVWLKYIMFVMLILLELTLILAGARAGWVSYPLVLLFCWAFLYFVKEGKIEFYKFNWRSYFKIVASVPITIVISLIVLLYVIFPLTEVNSDKTNVQPGISSQQSKDYMQDRVKKLLETDTRMKAWMQGIDAGIESPLFGLGYDSFAWHTSILSKVPESRYSVKKDNKFRHLHDTPHNLYVHFFVNWGIVGVTIWLIFILYCLMLLLYDLIKNHNLTNIPILISIMIFHIYGTFQSMQYVPMIWFFIFICIAYCLRISNDVLPQWIKYKTVNTNKYIFIVVLIGIFNYIYNFESKHIANKYNLSKYEYDQNYNQYMGFYPVEIWNGENYRWTGRNAKIKLNLKGRIQFKIQYHNIRLDLEPVKIGIFIDGNIVDTIIFTEKSNIITKEIIVDLGDSEEDKILGFSISRTWYPKKYGIEDARVLGAAVSDIKPVSI